MSAAANPPPAHLDPQYQAQPGRVAASAPSPTPPPAPGASPPADVAAPDPNAAFGKGSGVDLAPISRDMAEVKKAAAEGKLRLDDETAEALLKDLAAIKDKVDMLTVQAAELDVPLKLGNNWVADAMSKRLHAVAEGTDSAAIRVFKQFAMVVTDYEHAVRSAARRYYTTEGDLQSEMESLRRKADDDGSQL